jgi:hypothetical protein
MKARLWLSASVRLWFALFAALLALSGCEKVGTVCSNSGSTSECGRDHICTFKRTPIPFDPNADPPPPLSVCLRKCDTSTDCGEGELCQVVYCSTQKSCQTGPLEDPPPNVCEWLGTGGIGGSGGTGGTAGTGGTGGGEEPACDSEAWAYIQTLNPPSFNRTNFVQFVATNIPDDWDRYSISLDLTDPLLEGQIVQFGFSATASNFTPSGVFYDNVLVETGIGDALETEYDENFESLDQQDPMALGTDPSPPWGPGWVVFGNAFEADGTTFLYGYGPNPAPNNSGGFSGVALDQGGPAQGAQQLVIISDYNNQDQELGRRIEANTFRERTILAEDIGDTLVFNFDAKRGNINEGCPITGTGGMGGTGGMAGTGGAGGTGGVGGMPGTGGMSGAGGNP